MTLCSEAGITPGEFWQLTYREITNHLKGYSKREYAEWSRARWVSWWTYKANFKDPVPLQQFMPLDGDPKKKRKRVKLLIVKDFERIEKLWPIQKYRN